MDDAPRTAPYPPALAAYKYDHLRTRSLIWHLLRLFKERPDETLLSFEQVQELLRSRSEIDRGTRPIELARVVGSVGRYRDFDRAFLPLEGADSERWKRLDVAMNELRNLPPIDVYQIGDVYFVRDGNHRVSAARGTGRPCASTTRTIRLAASSTPGLRIAAGSRACRFTPRARR